MAGTLCLHAGAQVATLSEIAAVEVPPATRTWFPVSHVTVINRVKESLALAGFNVQKEQYGLYPGGRRMFGVLDLATELGAGTTLAVGVRNSIDKTFPMGMCAGNRVFVCDNLAFSSEILVTRKHTLNGERRYGEAIAEAVTHLGAFQVNERRRIESFRRTVLEPHLADHLILTAFEQGMLPPRQLLSILAQWRSPEFDWGPLGTAWHLYNAFTQPMQRGNVTNPARFTRQTMALMRLIGGACPGFDGADLGATPVIEGYRDLDDGRDDVVVEVEPDAPVILEPAPVG